MKKQHRILLIICVTVAIIAAAFGVVFGFTYSSGSFLYLDGERLCEIENPMDRGSIENDVRSKLEKTSVGDMDFTLECIYESTVSHNPVSEREAIDIVFSAVCDNYGRAYALICGDVRIAVAETYNDAETIIERLKSDAISLLEKNGESNIEISDKFEIKNIFCNRSVIKNINELISDVCGDGDGFSQSKGVSYGISKGSKTLDRNSFFYGKTGQKVHYSTVRTETFTETVGFETIFVESSKLYVGETQISAAGENGVVRKTVKVYIDADGNEKREVVATETVSPSKAQTKLVGTKAYPSTKPTGTFICPIRDRYTVTCVFGWKEKSSSTPHRGIDMALSTGHKIYAADGGTVVGAGVHSSYGLYVKIQHEKGIETLYAHMSQINVSEGDYVYKGQVIGLVGSTGNSTGPHLHFEVRIDGKCVDPTKYLP